MRIVAAHRIDALFAWHDYGVSSTARGGNAEFYFLRLPPFLFSLMVNRHRQSDVFGEPNAFFAEPGDTVDRSFLEKHPLHAETEGSSEECEVQVVTAYCQLAAARIRSRATHGEISRAKQFRSALYVLCHANA